MEESLHNSLSKGNANKCIVTVAETGLPGKHKKYLFLPSDAHVAKVVGFPGFMFTRPKHISIVNLRL